MSWHRVAVLVAYGFLLQCICNVNTSNQRQSLYEALRRRLSTITCYSSPAQPPYIVVPYPYLQTNGATPRVNDGGSKQVSQNKQIAARWPEYRVKLPLYMGRPIKTNIIIELPLSMFPQPGQTGTVNNTSSTNPSSSASNIESGGEEGANYENEGPSEPSSKSQPLDHQPDMHSTSTAKEPSNTLEGKDESPEESIIDSVTDKSDVACDNNSPSPLTTPNENNPTEVEKGDESYSEQTNDPKVSAVDQQTESEDLASNTEDRDASGATPNELVKTTQDNASTDPECVENTPESTSNKVQSEQLSSSNIDLPVAKSEKLSDNINPDSNASEKETIVLEDQTQGDEANDQKQTDDATVVDDIETTPSTADDIKKEELLTTASPTVEESTVTGDSAECNTSRTDDGTEITSASSADSAATLNQ